MRGLEKLMQMKKPAKEISSEVVPVDEVEETPEKEEGDFLEVLEALSFAEMLDNIQILCQTHPDLKLLTFRLSERKTDSYVLTNGNNSWAQFNPYSCVFNRTSLLRIIQNLTEQSPVYELRNYFKDYSILKGTKVSDGSNIPADSQADTRPSSD